MQVEIKGGEGDEKLIIDLEWLYQCSFSLFQIPVTYPATAPEIAIPELDGKTAKMYRY